ncbi:TIGR04219 family outer membrane beta-barrel protein [Photobacterium sp. J15]|uniref:TIGR04219 family outer membrane beta-barrel protein n=1 Tax=Photobacterium sp. J15 TaxID=265901 RepID=UPI000ACE8B29|nr:TIGR04219 family outer membrane beta-barrel protein [Photobacterium sp. J15]
MKKSVLAALLATAPFMASADMLIGGDVEVNMWQQSHNFAGSKVDGDDTSFTFEASLEHFVPLIPNFKIGQSSVDNSEYAYTKRDYTLYYEFLDNDLVSLDAGIGLSEFADGEIKDLGLKTEDFSGYLPHVYAAAEVGLPMTPIFVFAKGNGISYDDNTMFDASVGVQYSIGLYAFDLELQAGYRIHNFDFQDFDDLKTDFDAKTDGLFAGVNIDF